MTETIHIAAAVIFDAEGRVLLVRKRGTEAFMQPGGKLEPGETARAALVRELVEELGLVVDPAAPEPLGQFSAPAAHEPGATVVAEVFALPVVGAVAAGAEIAEIAWVDPARPDGRVLAELTGKWVLPAWVAVRG